MNKELYKKKKGSRVSRFNHVVNHLDIGDSRAVLETPRCKMHFSTK